MTLDSRFSELMGSHPNSPADPVAPAENFHPEKGATLSVTAPSHGGPVRKMGQGEQALSSAFQFTVKILLLALSLDVIKHGKSFLRGAPIWGGPEEGFPSFESGISLSGPGRTAISMLRKLPFFLPRTPETWRGLPSMKEAEDVLPPYARKGKQYLARIVNQLDAGLYKPSAEAYEGLSALAAAVSQGTTEEFVGVDIRLVNMTLLDSRSQPLSGVFRVTRYLGDGAANAVVEVVEKITKIPFAMRVLYSPYQAPTDIRSFAAFGRTAMEAELATMVRACGGTPAYLAASEKGIAVALYTAEIAGIPEIVFSGSVFVFREVQLMERLHGDLAHMLYKVGRLPMEAKEYIARRLVLQVLHLQKAGISHNDMKWSNCFMREDGSFLLGDFGSSTEFGESLEHQFTDVTPAYGEPNLLIELHQYSSNRSPPLPNPKSDIWTLGVLLYELFMDGTLPYGFSDSRHSLAAMSGHASSILSLNVKPDTLIAGMIREEVPLRWQGLICRLLDPVRSRRISAREVAEDFRELYFK